MSWLGSLIRLGNRTAAVPDGNYRICTDGNDPDTADQFSSNWCNLNLSGLAAGAATVGCCCNMVGFAVASYRENKVGGLLAQEIGTSMLQVPDDYEEAGDLASGDYIECNPRTGGNNGTTYDEQCDRFRYRKED